MGQWWSAILLVYADDSVKVSVVSDRDELYQKVPRVLESAGEVVSVERAKEGRQVIN
jgi:hypothetical protein